MIRYKAFQQGEHFLAEKIGGPGAWQQWIGGPPTSSSCH
jgi:hypothetical protein